jgi:hypothetical protein
MTIYGHIGLVHEDTQERDIYIRIYTKRVIKEKMVKDKGRHSIR